ncbi:MAG: hypothetical protein Q9218_001337 [Villophora microphyllina]
MDEIVSVPLEALVLFELLAEAGWELEELVAVKSVDCENVDELGKHRSENNLGLAPVVREPNYTPAHLEGVEKEDEELESVVDDDDEEVEDDEPELEVAELEVAEIGVLELEDIDEETVEDVVGIEDIVEDDDDVVLLWDVVVEEIDPN